MSEAKNAGKGDSPSLDASPEGEEKKPSIISKFLALFKPKPKILPDIGGHFKLTTQDLDWDKKIFKRWHKILWTYTNRTEKDDHEATLVLFREIQTSAEFEDKFLLYFWDEIWNGRHNLSVEISDICFTLAHQMLETKFDFFYDHPKWIFEDLESELPQIHEMGKKMCKKIFTENPAWFKTHFLWFNRRLESAIPYLKIVPFSLGGDVKGTSHKRKKRKSGKKEKSNTTHPSQSPSKPFGFDFTYLIWTEILDQFPDLILQYWPDMKKWLFLYDEYTRKHQQQPSSGSAPDAGDAMPSRSTSGQDLASLGKSKQKKHRKSKPSDTHDALLDGLAITQLDYLMKLYIEGMIRLIDQRSLTAKLKIPAVKSGITFLEKLMDFLLSGDLKGKRLLRGYILNLFAQYTHQSPEIFQDYPRISAWIHQGTDINLTNLIFFELFDRICVHHDFSLADLYFTDFLTHLSYGGDLMEKKAIQQLYVLHNEANYFAQQNHFQQLIFALDQERPLFHEHVRYIMFTVLKQNPYLMEFMKPKMEVSFMSQSPELIQTGIFFLKVLNEIVLTTLDAEVISYLFYQFCPCFQSSCVIPEIRVITANFFLFITQKNVQLMLPLRAWVDAQITQSGDTFDLKEIWVKIRMHLIRSQLQLSYT